ncbi:MAG: leucyl/phenylalanyl-tRNA--protein transferase [Actinomycetota bacterium]
MPIEPPLSRWDFPTNGDVDIDESGLVGVGADDEPGTILAAYRSALFPMPIEDGGPLGWWSPDPRGVLELDAVHVSRSLRRSMRRFEFRVDTAFDDVVAGCADPTRPHGWIDGRIRRAYRRLHDLGWAHSVETWCEGELVGGLYGLGIGGLFAAESKFHRVTDASKAAVVALAAGLADDHPRLIDVQWRTDHLATLGVAEIRRSNYLERLRTVLRSPDSALFADKTRTIPHPSA